MDFEFSRQDQAFREEVRSFLAEKLTPDIRRASEKTTTVFADKDLAMRWQAILLEKGWAVPAWPVEHGGTNWSPTQKYIWSEECARTHAPGLIPLGLRMLAPVVFKYGTEEQKNYYLPRMLTGEHYWCQGYSEPGSGSDLSSLKMPAVKDGDDYILNGTKIWTTHAREANWMFALVRTSRSDKKQRGITFVLIDMSAPGIEIRPLVMTSGEEVQNQVFFDDVRVPKANVIGDIDDGWTVAKYLLEFERGGGATAPALQVMAEDIATVSAQQPGPSGGRLLDDPAFAPKLAELRIRTEVLEILEYQVLAVVAAGGNPGAKSSMLKVLSTELSQALTELAMEAAGPRGRVYQPHATYPGGPIADFTPPQHDYVSGEPWQAVAPLRYFNDRAGSIYAGSNEIQRNILAKAALGL